jgi:hypothetical protein
VIWVSRLLFSEWPLGCLGEWRRPREKLWWFVGLDFKS